MAKKQRIGKQTQYKQCVQLHTIEHKKKSHSVSNSGVHEDICANGL